MSLLAKNRIMPNATRTASTSMDNTSADTHFRFLDLPAELRVNVYQHLLPHAVEIGLEPFVVRWRVPGKETLIPQGLSNGIFRPHLLRPIVPVPNGLSWRYGRLIKGGAISLFLVNKLILIEARAVLYGSNTYALTIDAYSREIDSLSSPDIFGALGAPSRLSLLRDLRSISIKMTPAHDNQYWGMRRHHGRLSLFVKILKDHTEDERQKSLLTTLKVQYTSYEILWGRNPTAVPKAQFSLEALATLRGIKDVEITGVAEWFAQCLQLCIQGKGGQLEPMVYPEVYKKTRVGPGMPWKRTRVTSKQWYMPAYNWKEFAERNKIDLPADIDNFWAER